MIIECTIFFCCLNKLIRKHNFLLLQIRYILILVYFLLAGLVLQAFGLYQYLVDFAGAGATVPISGFGYLLAEGAIKGAQQGLFSAFTGGVIAASAGITAAIVFGYLNALIFKAKSKPN